MTQRILCLGNNTEDTDIKTRAIAKNNNLPHHGLLSDLESLLSCDQYSQTGCYHTSIYDVEVGRLKILCEEFDQVIMLDQPKPEWSHPDAFYNTIKLLKNVAVPVTFLDPAYRSAIDFFENLVVNNKSFCIFPFVELLTNFDHTTVCCRSTTPVTKLSDLGDYSTNQQYVDIRKKMISGTLLPEYCSSCYSIEEKGIISARIQETVEWANRLNLQTIDDLDKIKKPAYYEIRPSNKCNLQCRTCDPQQSHLIDKEYKKIGIISTVPVPKMYDTGFDIVDFDNLFKLYVAGGEPTVMAEFYRFLDECIERKVTDFELLVNTNGTNISNKLKDQLKHFSNFQFVFSIDGYKDLNYYIRWPSDWATIVKNWQYLRDNGHKIVVNTTVSIYNISTLDRLFEFVDQEFPGTLIHCQLAETQHEMSPFLFPDKNLALASLKKITKMTCYQNDLLFASSIDGYIKQFEQHHQIDWIRLKKFFNFNQKLDQSRQIKLLDYAPELDFFQTSIYNKTL